MGTHALGRGLFENWIGFWPTSDSPMAVPVNTIPKVVFTSRPGYDPGAQNPDAGGNWAETRVAGGELVAEIDRLKREPGGYVLAQGGLAFGRSLVRAGVVDEYRFAVLPVALGQGEGLFTQLDDELDLELVASTAFRGGAMGSVYRPR